MKIIKAHHGGYHILLISGMHVNFNSFEHRDGYVTLIIGNEIAGIIWQDKAPEFFRAWRVMQCQ